MTEPEEGQTQEEVSFDASEEWRSLDLIFDQVEKQLDIQWQLRDSVDGRLRLLLGFIGVIFALALNFVSEFGLLDWAARGLIMLALLLLIVAAIVAGVAYTTPRLFQRPPRPPVLVPDYLPWEPMEAKYDIVAMMAEAYNENEQVIDGRVRLFKLAFAFMGIAVLILAIAVIVQVGRGTTL